ncbi:glycosyltransferase family 2 protein [Alteromonas sp. ASW11-36]|uniref:Glycosyltransferase family 2 protein n=1 Tax=Alteromonas arenosi TaxID=3055817 RepID=A0ABT7SUF9_9ALTE|nr:glycosyltransferase family 2 protein [Alteromonas sp. ASW11-36]MDM7859639.1 glycosyltransferase family 2 protein [Alteromonas sp. ASW11-36]
MADQKTPTNDPLISIIVPVYNVEKYLVECLDSLLAQTYKNLEIIVVDDCSPDNSAAIIERYVAKDKRVKAVKRAQNGGLSAARNSGIEHATGEWITFVDSDDYLHTDCYRQTLSVMSATDKCNVGIFSVVYLNDETKQTSPAPYFHVNLDSPNWFWDCNVTSWNKIFLAKHISDHNIRFAEGLYHEDEDFWFKYCAAVDLVPAVTNEPLYYYRQRGASITSNNSSRKQLPDIFASMKTFAQSRNLLISKRDYLLFRASIFIRILNNKLTGEEKLTALSHMRQLMEELQPNTSEVAQMLPIAQYVYMVRDDSFLPVALNLADQMMQLQKQSNKSIARQLLDRVTGS